MKAYDWMMGLLMFNLAIAILAGTGVWNFGYDFYTLASLTVTIGFGTVVGFIAALVAASGISILSPSGQKTERTAVYLLFSGTFWGLWLNTSRVLNSITGEAPGNSLIIIGVFSVVCLLLYITGIAQMVTGGWNQYE